MKKIPRGLFYLTLIFFSSLLISGCKKKEPPEPQFELFLSFEKDGQTFNFEGTELSNVLGTDFGSIWDKTDGPITSRFKLESWCAFDDPSSEDNDIEFNITFYQLDTSHVFSSGALDELFAEGIKSLNVPSIIIGSITHITHFIIINYNYRTSYAITKRYSQIDCDLFSFNKFEITDVDWIKKDGKISAVIMEANFEITLCYKDDEDQIRLTNGKLRYYFEIPQ